MPQKSRRPLFNPAWYTGAEVLLGAAILVLMIGAGAVLDQHGWRATPEGITYGAFLWSLAPLPAIVIPTLVGNRRKRRTGLLTSPDESDS